MIKLAIIDDNSFLIKATQEKLSLFEDCDLNLQLLTPQPLLAETLFMK